MDADRELARELLPTPFVSSFVGRARPGDVYDPDHARRAAAWAHWAVESLTRMSGLHDRSYVALRLPGKFYDPKGNGPSVRPHLEVPARLLDRPAPELPDRLAQAGNGLLFGWWVFSEVTAVRRALFNTSNGSVADLVELLAERRDPLADAVSQLAGQAEPRWAVIEGLLVSSPDGLSPAAAGDFSSDEVAEFFPAGAALQLEVVYDSKLRDKNGSWASRRVGVWQLRGVNSEGQRFSLGAVTPRLTAGSLFHDAQFDPARESGAALLVRGLLLRRLVRSYLSPQGVTAVADGPGTAASAKGGPYLRAVVARVGAKLPEASVEAAVHFLQTFADADAAWQALHNWAGDSYLLTVTEEAFSEAHGRALRALRRAEEPERDDLNVVLPLAWDDKSRVVRATFSRPASDEDE